MFWGNHWTNTLIPLAKQKFQILILSLTLSPFLCGFYGTPVFMAIMYKQRGGNTGNSKSVRFPLDQRGDGNVLLVFAPGGWFWDSFYKPSPKGPTESNTSYPEQWPSWKHQCACPPLQFRLQPLPLILGMISQISYHKQSLCLRLSFRGNEIKRTTTKDSWKLRTTEVKELEKNKNAEISENRVKKKKGWKAVKDLDKGISEKRTWSGRNHP